MKPSRNTTVRIACYGLSGTAVLLAVVLGGMLVFGRDSGAEARMVSTHQNLTLLTAQTRENEDSLFVLDNSTGTLLVYRVDARDTLHLGGQFDLNEVFGPAPRGR